MCAAHRAALALYSPVLPFGEPACGGRDGPHWVRCNVFTARGIPGGLLLFVSRQEHRRVELAGAPVGMVEAVTLKVKLSTDRAARSTVVAHLPVSGRVAE